MKTPKIQEATRKILAGEVKYFKPFRKSLKESHRFLIDVGSEESRDTLTNYMPELNQLEVYNLVKNSMPFDTCSVEFKEPFLLNVKGEVFDIHFCMLDLSNHQPKIIADVFCRGERRLFKANRVPSITDLPEDYTEANFAFGACLNVFVYFLVVLGRSKSEIIKPLMSDDQINEYVALHGYKPKDVVVIRPSTRSDEIPTGESIREYTHRWEVRGHWRKCQGIGKDRHGIYNQANRTWIRESVRGPEELPLVKKTRVLKTGANT